MGKLFKVISIILVLILVVGSVFIIGLKSQQQPSVPEYVANPKPVKAEPVPTPEDATQEVVSPDGKWSAILTKKSGLTNSTYTLAIKDLEKSSKKEIYRTTLLDGDNLELPPNTFSPTDKYVFLKKKGDKTEYIVMKASGEDLVKDQQTIEISSLFYKKYEDYVITDVTGWGGYTLLVVNTDKKEGGTGPSFWLDMSGFSFIRLSTRFN